MKTLLTLLPLYIFGNLHCLGMCGPLVLMLGAHKYRNFYFFGRILSFTLAGSLAGGFGAVIHAFFAPYHIGAFVSFLFGSLILGFGVLTLLKLKLPIRLPQGGVLKKVNLHLSTLMLRDTPFAVFLFGFFTLLLPCGQTVIVYSALAIDGNLYSGTLNGFIFALLTSPSLFFAMRAVNFLKQAKQHYHSLLGLSAFGVGIIFLCRGLAEMEMIPHFVLSPGTSSDFHIALF